MRDVLAIGLRHAADNRPTKNLGPETLCILERVEALSGRPVAFKPDSSLTVQATLQMARNGANEPVPQPGRHGNGARPHRRRQHAIPAAVQRDRRADHGQR